MKHFLLKLLCFATLMGCGNAWAETWRLCTISELSSNDIFVIVDANSGNAMTNNNGTSSAPAAANVTISQDGKTITEVTDVMKWNISGNGTDGYTIYPNGSTTTWLYATSTNNGLRVGTNDNKTFVIANHTNGEPFLKHNGTSRYIGVYNSQDWRCYTSVNTNINATQTRFYKYENESDTRTKVNLTDFTTTDNATSIVKGGTLNTSVANDQNGWTASYIYTSSNKDVATVNESGVITAVSKGSACITVSLNIANNDANYKVGKTASKYVDITVKNPSHTAQFSVNGDINHEYDKDIEEGEPITFPNDPTSPAVPEGKVFMGWKKGGEEITTPQDEAIPVVKTSEKMGDSDVTYYAVFATKVENVKEYTFTISPKEFNGKSYAANDGEHTIKSISTDKDEKDVMYNTSNVMLQSNKIQFKSSSGILYNTTDLGTINSVSLTEESNVTVYYGSSEKPTTTTNKQGGFFSVKAKSSLGSVSSIIVSYSIDNTSYSDYCTKVNVVEISSISIKIAPTKLTYLAGESFDPTGLVITAHYEDESSKDIEYNTHKSSFSFVKSSNLDIDDNSVTITYGGKSVNQPICILPVNTIVLNFNEGWTVNVNDNIASGKDNNNKDVSIECEGSRDPFGLKGTPKYLAFNGRNATITLPAFDFPVSKIEVVGPSSEANPSKDIEQNIYVGETAVSTTTKGWGDNYVRSFDIDPKYQAPGLQYSLKIESDNSSHVTEIRIFKNEDYKFTISYVVNGAEIKTESLSEDEGLTFPTNPEDLLGKKFMGWVDTPIDGTQSMAPTFVTPTDLKATDNKTYYAVFASLVMAPSNTFTRISATELTDGMTIAITNTGSYILNTEFDGSQLSKTESNSTITVTEPSQKWVVKSVDGGWNICNGNSTIGFETAPTASKKNRAASLTNTNNVWAIEEHTSPNKTVMIHNGTTFIDYYNEEWPVYYNDRGNGSSSVELRLYKSEFEENYTNFCTEFASLSFVATDGKSYYATFSNPRNVVMPAEGISAYLVSVTDGKMVLTDLEKDCNDGEYWNLPSNTGYLLKNTSNASVVYTFVTESLGKVDPSLNMLVPCTTTGTFKEEDDDNTYYKLAYGNYTNQTNLGFWWGAEGGTGKFTVKAGGAILAVPQSSASASILRGLSFDEAVSNETNISKIGYSNSESSIIYNAQGIQVETIKENGLYVVNGKVIMIKK